MTVPRSLAALGVRATAEMELDNGAKAGIDVLDHNLVPRTRSGRLALKADDPYVVVFGDDPDFVLNLDYTRDHRITRVDGRPLHAHERVRPDVPAGDLELDLQLTDLGDGTVRLRIDCREEPSLWMEIVFEVAKAP